MRIVAILLGLVILAGTIVLVIAGASGPHAHSNVMGPLAFLLCIVAVVAMIVLGVTLGGRNNPRRAPHSPASRSQAAATVTVGPVKVDQVTVDPVNRDPANSRVESDQPGDLA